ncbi:MAG: ribonuclease HII [Bacillaceae bacterium]|nr:ribonuclease HII [Bacillaceae bacterium]
MAEHKTIQEIKQMLQTDTYTDEEWQQFINDQRKGVQKLIQTYQKKLEKKNQLKQQFEKMKVYEKSLYQKGMYRVAGIDEAGRGPLAGPVVAAACILPEDFYLEGLNDSKKLSENQRNEFFERIREAAVTYGIGIVDNQMIDRINIYQAAKLAMKKAVSELTVTPEYLFIDAMELKDLPIPQLSLTKGDQRSISIAAASILAKVTRDRMMKEIHEQYPEYGFGTNMGYGTSRHLETLKSQGPCPYHRLTFAPVKDFIK